MADDDRSKKAYELYRTAQDKFEYFVVGAAAALCAYVGQNLKPEQLGFSPATLELVALLILILSVIVGFKRLETMVRAGVANHVMLHHTEMRGTIRSAAVHGKTMITGQGDIIDPPEAFQRADVHEKASKAAQAQADQLNKSGQRLYHWRNRLLLSGFLLLVAARVWVPYY